MKKPMQSYARKALITYLVHPYGCDDTAWNCETVKASTPVQACELSRHSANQNRLTVFAEGSGELFFAKEGDNWTPFFESEVEADSPESVELSSVKAERDEWKAMAETQARERAPEPSRTYYGKFETAWDFGALLSQVVREVEERWGLSVRCSILDAALSVTQREREVPRG